MPIDSEGRLPFNVQILRLRLESLWPYVEHKFATRPSRRCHESALGYGAVKYYRLQCDIYDVRACLASSYPFIFGFLAHEKFFTVVRRTGVLDMPGPRERVIGKQQGWRSATKTGDGGSS